MTKLSEATHVVSARLFTEEYGWLVRYCEKNDITMSAVIRKALRTYRAAVNMKNKEFRDLKEMKKNLTAAGEKNVSELDKNI